MNRSCYIVILQEFKLNIDGNSEQAEAQEKTIRVLSKMSVRLQTIEHRMELLHMQPPPTPKKGRLIRFDFVFVQWYK